MLLELYLAFKTVHPIMNMETAGITLDIQDITKEAMDEYEAIIVHTHLPLKSGPQDDVETFVWGRYNGNLIVFNESNARKEGDYGTTIAEHWMLFPDEISISVTEALNAVNNGSERLFDTTFSLQDFTELCITLKYRSPEAHDATKKLLEEGSLKEAVVLGLKNAGYDSKIGVKYTETKILAKESK